jgi:hypothetical protein
MPHLWMHRPSTAEHAELLKAMKEADYPSVSAFVREATLRLVYADDKRPLFSLLRDHAQKMEEVLEDLKNLTEEECGDGDTVDGSSRP